MSITVGKSVARVDAFDKVTGRTKYYEDRMPAGALYIRIKHAEIAHGFVKSVDTAAAEAIDGVVKVLTCFDVPDIPFPTAGHPWSMDPGHQDVADRHLLNRHVRYYGDDVAVVIAENEVAAMQGVRALKVEYGTALRAGRSEGHGAGRAADPREVSRKYPQAHGHPQRATMPPPFRSRVSSRWRAGTTPPRSSTATLKTTAAMPTRKTAGWWWFPPPRSPISSAGWWGRLWAAPGRISRSSSPYIGGGFGNKQDALYEPLCAWCSTQVGGRCVRMDCAREETFVSNRVRHAIRFHIISWLRKDGSWPPGRWSASPIRGLRLPRPLHLRQGYGLLRPDLSLRQHGVRRLDRVYQPALAAPCGATACPRPSLPDEANIDECRRRGHGPAGIPHEVHHA